MPRPSTSAVRVRSGASDVASTPMISRSACSSGTPSARAGWSSSRLPRASSTWVRPSGSAKRTRPSSRATVVPCSVSRRSQKSSDASSGTRHEMEWNMPPPGCPGAAPGTSKKVSSVRGLPPSSP